MMDRTAEIRKDIAQAIKSVRLSCFGRKCFKECQRRMAMAAPCRRATRRRWGAAMAAVLVCMGALAQEIGSDPGIRCSWVDDGGGSGHYECSGYGSSVYVYGGGGVTVTNAFGSCTNCISMSPQSCTNLREQVGILGVMIENLSLDVVEQIIFLNDAINSNRADIATFQRIGDAPIAWNSTYNDVLSNYVWGVVNTQTRLDLQHLAPGTRNNAWWNRWASYNNGIYDYAKNQVQPLLDYSRRQLETIQDGVGRNLEMSRSMKDQVLNNLNCEACGSGGGDGGGGGGSSTNDCSACAGDWCTEEQGDAILLLLEDMKDYTQRIGSLVLSISNSVAVAVKTLQDGLFTSYTHIPAEPDLGMTWQELYLSGYSPNFHEYASTNILARIELLLAGMSGVLTNSNEISASLQDEFQSSADEVESAITGFSADVAEAVATREQKVRSVGDAIVGLYSAFRGWSGTPFSRETLVNSYSVEIGNDHWDVPSFEPSENGLRVANLIRVVCRSVMSVVYILFTVAIFVRFHISFFQWVLKYLKWAIELMQGLFA